MIEEKVDLIISILQDINKNLAQINERTESATKYSSAAQPNIDDILSKVGKMFPGAMSQGR